MATTTRTKPVSSMVFSIPQPHESVTVDGFFGKSVVHRYDMGSRSVMTEQRTVISEYFTILVTAKNGDVQFGIWEDQGVVEVAFAMLEGLLDAKKAVGTDVVYQAYHPESLYTLVNKVSATNIREFLTDLPNLCPAGPLTFVIEYTKKP